MLERLVDHNEQLASILEDWIRACEKEYIPREFILQALKNAGRDFQTPEETYTDAAKLYKNTPKH